MQKIFVLQTGQTCSALFQEFRQEKMVLNYKAGDFEGHQEEFPTITAI